MRGNSSAKELPPYKARVIEEAAHLEAKLRAFDAFLETDTCAALMRDEQASLHAQRLAMRQYIDALHGRIAIWGWR